MIALTYSEMNDFDKAVEEYKFAIQIGAKPDIINYYIGSLYERKKDIVMAEKYFKKSIEFNPEHADAYNYLGYMWAEQGINLEESTKFIQKALDIDPNNGAYIDSLGWSYYQRGMIFEAIEELKKAVKFLDKDPVIREHLGDAYHKMGKVEEAINEWKRAYIMDPHSESLKTKLEQNNVSPEDILSEDDKSK